MRALSLLSRHGGPRTHRAIAIATCCARPGGGGGLCDASARPRRVLAISCRLIGPAPRPYRSTCTAAGPCQPTTHMAAAPSRPSSAGAWRHSDPPRLLHRRGVVGPTISYVHRYPYPGCTHSLCIHNTVGMRRRKNLACNVRTRARCEETRTSAEEAENMGKSNPRSPPRCCELLQTPSGAAEAFKISTILP
jgi:hypothetical protein